jgi:hypothetical protein
MMIFLIYVGSNLIVIAGLIIAFLYVLRSGKIFKGILIGYGLSIICISLASVVLPGIVAIYDKEYCQYFPEAIAVPAIIFTGWLPVSIVVIIALIIRHIAKRFWPCSGKMPIKEENTEKTKDNQGGKAH